MTGGKSVPWLAQHWLYSSYRFGTGQSEPLLYSPENLPASTESPAQLSAVVGHLFQERHWVQQNHVRIVRSEHCRVSLTHPPLMRSPLSTRKCIIHFLLSNNYVLFIRWKRLICLGHIRCLGCWRLISTLSGLEQCIILVHFIYIL